MYSTIEGKLVESGPAAVVIQAGGIGYKIFIPASALYKLPDKGKTILLYTSLVTREMVQSLYGFVERKERELFELLIQVSGIGPKIALSLIGHMSCEEFSGAIAMQDTAAISRVPGIGKKSAERVVMELKDKFSKKGGAIPSEFAISFGTGDSIGDAVSALRNLGYSQAAAEKAIGQSLKVLPKDPDLASLLTESLKRGR